MREIFFWQSIKKYIRNFRRKGMALPVHIKQMMYACLFHAYFPAALRFHTIWLSSRYKAWRSLVDICNERVVPFTQRLSTTVGDDVTVNATICLRREYPGSHLLSLLYSLSNRVFRQFAYITRGGARGNSGRDRGGGHGGGGISVTLLYAIQNIDKNQACFTWSYRRKHTRYFFRL